MRDQLDKLVTEMLDKGILYDDARREFEKMFISRALQRTKGNLGDAADILTVNDRDQLERAFRRLTLEQRTVLVFHHYVGLQLTEVADRLGIPIGTVKSRLHHATTALRASLEADARTPSVSQERMA